MFSTRHSHGAAHPRCFARPELIELTRFFAGEVADGKYPYIDYDADDRWHQRVYRDLRVDVWLISWLPSQGTQLHDHGGSSGAFTVLSGTLSEAVLRGDELADRDHAAGSSVGFGSRYVHDVRNLSERPAVSVHAYSAPLTSMTYYDLADGVLSPIASLDTDDPEPALEPAAIGRAS